MIRIRSSLAWLLLVVAVGGGLSGCASAGDRAASKQLGLLHQSVSDEAMQNFRRGDDPVVLARWATNDSGSYEVGNGQQFDQRVEALSWSSKDGMDGIVDLRLTVTTPGFRSTSFSGPGSYGPASAQRCVRIYVGAASDDSVDRIACRDRPAVVVPPAPPPPAPLSEAALAKAMKKPSLRDAEAAARNAFPGLSVTADTVDDSWVVVVIREAPALACLGGTRSPQGKVKVSTVSRIRPGEADCGPVTFVRGPA